MKKINLISDIYGDGVYNKLITHLKANIYKHKNAETKLALSSFSYDDIMMYPEFAGRNLKGLRIRVKPKLQSTTELKNILTQNASGLIEEAKRYRKFLEDPDLLQDAGFKHKWVESKPVCGVKVDCYEGTINNQKGYIKNSLFCLEVHEQYSNVKKVTYINGSGGQIQILFIETDKSGNETILRKVQQFMNSDIFDWIKLNRKL